jgi:hypothetical protein
MHNAQHDCIQKTQHATRNSQLPQHMRHTTRINGRSPHATQQHATPYDLFINYLIDQNLCTISYRR